MVHPEGTTIPARKSLPPWPVCHSLTNWRHYPRLFHIRTASVDQLVIQEHLNHIFHRVSGKRKTYDKLKLWHPKRWITSASNELVQLDLCLLDRNKYGTEFIFIIHKHQFPAGRKATYANAVCDNITLKCYPYPVRLTVGGDRLIYSSNPSAPATSLLDSKTIFNTTISTPGR